MPFTFSHPSLVLPFIKAPKKWLSATGLLIGSTLPDFEYFLRLEFRADIGHSLIGIPLFCLPVGLILCYLFHHLIRDAFIENLPWFWQARLHEYKSLNWHKHVKTYPWAVIGSICLGAGSHIFLDAFTHGDGFFVERWSFLQSMIWQMPAYAFLQLFLSLLGLIIMLGYVAFRSPAEAYLNQVNWSFWGTLILFTFLMAFIFLNISPSQLIEQKVVVCGISGGLAALILTPIFVKS
jgi:hypothetical protein